MWCDDKQLQCDNVFVNAKIGRQSFFVLLKIFKTFTSFPNLCKPYHTNVFICLNILLTYYYLLLQRCSKICGWCDDICLGFFSQVVTNFKHKKICDHDAENTTCSNISHQCFLQQTQCVKHLSEAAKNINV